MSPMMEQFNDAFHVHERGTRHYRLCRSCTAYETHARNLLITLFLALINSFIRSEKFIIKF